ncbi:FAD-dependent monooxygenase [Paraburkholderia sp. 2C]
MVDTTDVVIAGGGPVGLWLSCELALAGVKVTVVERRTERIVHSRALTLHGRSLEMLELRGLAERFLALGRPLARMHYAALSTQLDMSVFDTRYPFTLFIPQATTERLLEERALELGVDLRRGHMVESIEQHADGVFIEGQSAAGHWCIAAQFAVGADGARSLVRRSLGIEFAGYPARNTLAAADVALLAPPEGNTLLTANEAGGLIMLPRGDGVHFRIGMLDVQSRDVCPSEPLTLDELAAAMARIGGRDFGPHDPLWLTRFTDETRVAQQYRDGRILLAGDAAHIQAPMGGQGMNVGLQDAMNLGWKLASVIHGIAPDTLLDSYQRERLPVAITLRDNTLAQLSLFSHFDPPTLALRRVFDTMLQNPELNRQLANEIAGFSVAYPEPLDAAPDGWEHVAGISGERIKDRRVTLQDGTSIRASRLLESGRTVCLRFARDAALPAGHRAIRPFDIQRTDDDFYPDLAALMIRPDGYVSHVRRATPVHAPR